jgi:hypothetical protein
VFVCDIALNLNTKGSLISLISFKNVPAQCHNHKYLLLHECSPARAKKVDPENINMGETQIFFFRFTVGKYMRTLCTYPDKMS